ncbi:hypothetical protein BC826DRAFT_1172340 [Russula brevipes]|nr:hypothetical protein BC826DRAFT_1172340 [Russula brevipes]
MSKVLSSDSSEHHSPPLSNNKERRGTNLAPLMSSVSVRDNASNDEPSARQPSPIFPQRRLVKSPSAQPPGPSTPSSKYTRRPSLFQHQQREQHQRQQESQQRPLSPGALARHGIKVRDFAYESDLPLIPSIPRVRQLVIGPRPLKRTKHYFDPPDDVFTVDTRSHSQSAGGAAAASTHATSLESDPRESLKKSSPLERKSTEPVIFPEREPRRPYRDVGYADLSQLPSGSQAIHRIPHHSLTPLTPTAVHRTSSFSPTSLPFPFPATKRWTAGSSQESEPSTDTPLVTPKGSLTWPAITSDVPASQLDNGGSQTPALGGHTTAYSQLAGFSPFLQPPPPLNPHSQSDTSAADADAVGSPRPTEPASSPLRPPPDVDHTHHLDGNDDDGRRRRRWDAHILADASAPAPCGAIAADGTQPGPVADPELPRPTILPSQTQFAHAGPRRVVALSAPQTQAAVCAVPWPGTTGHAPVCACCCCCCFGLVGAFAARETAAKDDPVAWLKVGVVGGVLLSALVAIVLR